jgi:phosphomannomutase
MKQLLERLGCTVVGLNLEESGLFAHMPEPVPSNLGDLCALVKREKADLGIAVDPDVDRCVLIDECGEPLGEEYTLALAVELVVGRCGKRGPICKNLSTSRVIDELGERYGCEVVNTPVGEIHVAKVMVERRAVIGGEGNGGVMLPDIHIGRDAPVAAALALELLCRHGGSLSSLKCSLPQWTIVKLKAPLRGSDPDSVIAQLKAKWQDNARLSDSDGLRIDTADWWVHLRKSNTEPIIRIIGEARDQQSILKTCQEFQARMRTHKEDA